eukprot:COSAG01_NODE_3033_length_6694_cov_2.154056_4_plen_553_part_00
MSSAGSSGTGALPTGEISALSAAHAANSVTDTDAVSASSLPPPSASSAVTASAEAPGKPGSRKRQIHELEQQLARGETLSKCARKKLLKLRYKEEVLPQRKQQQQQQRRERRAAKKARRQAASAEATQQQQSPLPAAAAAVAATTEMPEQPFVWTPARPPAKRGRAFWESIGAPRLVAAPMVNQSELPFRLLMRRHGAQLCFTPMLDSRSFARSEAYRVSAFSTVPADRPLIAQFCGDDPRTLLSAARLVQSQCDAVDLNFGCPQGIAKRGHYGAFLLSEPPLVASLVRTLARGLEVPVTVKMRVLPAEEGGDEATLALARAFEEAGASLLTVHGRTVAQKGQRTGTVNWEIIRQVKQAVSIPVLANGGIEFPSDVRRCLEVTGADGVMSSEALLESPDLFGGVVLGGGCADDDGDDASSVERAWVAGRSRARQCALALEYVQLARTHPPSAAAAGQRDTRSNGIMKSHLFKMLYSGLQEHVDLRDRLQFAQTFEQHAAVVTQLAERVQADAPPAAVEAHGELGGRTSWYRRHPRTVPASTTATPTSSASDQ